jgi:hypothetical protein
MYDSRIGGCLCAQFNANGACLACRASTRFATSCLPMGYVVLAYALCLLAALPAMAITASIQKCIQWRKHKTGAPLPTSTPKNGDGSKAARPAGAWSWRPTIAAGIVTVVVLVAVTAGLHVGAQSHGTPAGVTPSPTGSQSYVNKTT